MNPLFQTTHRLALGGRMLLLCLLVGLTALPAFAQTTRYVTTTGTNADPAAATSWSTSTTDLQGAIEASEPGDAVWIAAGTYQPGGPANTDRTISFTMKNGVAIYGGFAGNEAVLSERPVINTVAGQPSSTTLSGEMGSAGNDDNSYHVVSSNGLDNTAILDGVVITGGNAPLDNRTNGFGPGGGGMYNYNNSSPSLTNVSFINNTANAGGGMYNYNNSSPTLTNVSFLNNKITYNDGGGMYNYNSSPVLTNVSFLNNTTTDYGGGMFNQSNSSPSLTNVSFINNTADNSGGGMCNFNNSNPVLTNVSFLNNTANAGGGMYNYNNSSPVLTNCVLFGNGGSNTFYNIESMVSATYSLFDTGAETSVDVSGPGNLTNVTSSPFVSPTSVALLPCSPAVNAGSNAANSTAIDLAGNPRFIGDIIDMGAVELQILPYVAITGQPAASSVVSAGSTVTTSVSTSGTVSSFQWYQDGTSLPSQTAATLTLTNVQPANSGSYSVVVTGSCNSLTSTAFSLTVTQGMTQPPLSQTVCKGSRVVLTVVVPGAASYQWFETGQSAKSRISDKTGVYAGTSTNSLTLVSVQGTANYFCRVTMANGSVQWLGQYNVTVNKKCTSNSRLGIEEEIASLLTVTLLSNPIEGGQVRALVGGATDQPLTVQLHDTRGHLIRQQAWQQADGEQHIEWDLSSQPAGIYLLRAVSNGQQQTVKVVKQ